MAWFARLLCIALLVPPLAGCRPRVARQDTSAPPLLDDGEVYVYLQPHGNERGRLEITLESIAATTHDAGTMPLQLARPRVAGGEEPSQTLLATGRVPPGAYTGLTFAFARATLANDEGTADLLVPGPVQVVSPFTVALGKAVVLWVSVGFDESVRAGFELSPALRAVTAPAKPIAALMAYCSNTAANNVTAFDRRQRQVTQVLPTGRSPHGIAIDRLRNRAYVALSGEDEVEVLDLAAGNPIARIRLDTGDEPRDIALTPDGRLLVTINPGSETASFVDPLALRQIARVRTGEEPSALVLDRAGRRGYVLNARSGTITALDLANRAVAATVSTGTEPFRAAVNAAGTRLFVIDRTAPFMSVLSLPDLAPAGQALVGPGIASIHVDPRTDFVYLARGDAGIVSTYEPNSLVEIGSLRLPAPISSMAIDDLENTLLLLMPSLRSAAVVELATNRAVSFVEVGERPYDLALAGER